MLTRTTRDRPILLAAVAALAALPLFLTADAALARRRVLRSKAAAITEVFTPLGVQGIAGAGSQVQLAFRIVDQRRRPNRAEFQYGWDRDGSGVIEDHEYAVCTSNDHDPRATAQNIRIRRRRPWPRYITAPGRGTVHGFVWDSAVDVGPQRHLLQHVVYGENGRTLRDPDDPTGGVLTRRGSGMRMRVRAVYGRGRRSRGAWEYSDPFDFDNRLAPSMTFDGVTAGGVTFIDWTSFAPHAEDADDTLRAAFDYARLAPGQDAARMTDEELGELAWRACWQAEGLGDPDRGIVSSPDGRMHVFAWDAAAQAGTTAADRFVLRGRVVDETDKAGDWTYFRTDFGLN